MSNFVSISAHPRKRPPSFEHAKSLRHKAWSAGFDPAYWYAVEFSKNVRDGQAIEVEFQGTSVAVFRGEDGALGAIENRCAHRQVKLSDGEVHGCQLMCRYHGWTYDADGCLTGIAHDVDSTTFPKVRLRRYPVAEKYGLIFVFFGDPALLPERPLPRVEVLEGSEPWFVVPIDFTMACHPTAYVNNVMDSTHVASLHRKFRTRSLIYSPVKTYETKGDSVTVTHDIDLDPGGLLRHMVKGLKTREQHAVYEYPHLHVHVGGVFELWNFILPVNERTTRIFLLSCSERVTIPFTSIAPPDALVRPFTAIAREILVRPLFDEDVWSTEAEQLGFDRYFDERELEPHPSIRPSYELTVRKWEEHLARMSSASNGPHATDRREP